MCIAIDSVSVKILYAGLSCRRWPRRARWIKLCGCSWRAPTAACWTSSGAEFSNFLSQNNLRTFRTLAKLHAEAKQLFPECSDRGLLDILRCAHTLKCCIHHISKGWHCWLTKTVRLFLDCYDRELLDVVRYAHLLIHREFESLKL